MEKPARQTIRNKLKARAYRALTDVQTPIDKPITVRAHDATHQVAITVTPAGAVSPTSSTETYMGGQMFGPEEVAVVNVLDHESWMVGKEIGRRCCVVKKGMSRLFVVVSLLCARKVLIKNPEGNGYRLHPDFSRPGLRSSSEQNRSA